MKMQLYVVIRGAPREAASIRELFSGLLDHEPRSDNKKQESNSLDVRIGGLDVDSIVVDRFWLVAAKPSAALKRITMKIARQLQWKAELRWGVSGASPGVPPNLEPLLKRRAVRNRNWMLPIIAGILIAAVHVDILRTIMVNGINVFGIGISGTLAATTTTIVVMLFVFAVKENRHTILGGLMFCEAFLLMIVLLVVGSSCAKGLMSCFVTLAAIVLLYAYFTFHRKPTWERNFSRQWFWTTYISSVVKRSLEEKRCIVCDYRLCGVEAYRCPECGTTNYQFQDQLLEEKKTRKDAWPEKTPG